MELVGKGRRVFVWKGAKGLRFAITVLVVVFLLVEGLAVASGFFHVMDGV